MKLKNILKPISPEEIDSKIKILIEEFEKTHMSQGFTWRPGQMEAVYQIIHTYLSKKHNVVIVDAPVGSGKSLIAMATSFILNKVNKKGYVLTSEISLQDQYEKDVKEYLLSWGSVKGIDNYICIDNMEKHSLGTCKIRNLNPGVLDCFDECPYFRARFIAHRSPTSILNYNYWLIMQNMGENSLFQKRDFTICDEAHKILGIVQNHYSPRFTKTTVEKLQKFSDFFKTQKVDNFDADVKIIQESIDKIINTEDQYQLFELLKKIEYSLKKILKNSLILSKIINKKFKSSKIPKSWISALHIRDWIKDMNCKITDYNYIISETNIRNIIKNPSLEDITFNCLDEGFLMGKYFHKFTGFCVLMSATIADPKEYMRSMNIKGAKYIKIENNFPFEKSPIYYYPNRKMSYKHLDNNKEWLFSKINELIEKHNGESGIIHTASYDLAVKINENLSSKNRKRVFIYTGTEEKRRVLDMMKSEKGKIIMGPSILEGLDLKDDLSRFAIFAKVPYMSLTDNFVKAKMKVNPNWYQWRTVINILQGTGRSVRSDTDWATTYILDGSFGNLIHNNRNSFPPEFLQRIIIVNE